MISRNFEFKAKVAELGHYESRLLQLNPVFHGVDYQTDTYFNVAKGRLKLREGTIENALINYTREDTAGSKKSEIILYQHQPDTALKDILTLHFGVKNIVSKKRKIYFIGNVKFHFDTVENLGTFIEVEAIDTVDKHTIEELKEQCDYYFYFFGLGKSSFIEKSYCDLLENKNEQ